MWAITWNQTWPTHQKGKTTCQGTILLHLFIIIIMDPLARSFNTILRGHVDWEKGITTRDKPLLAVGPPFQSPPSAK